MKTKADGAAADAAAAVTHDTVYESLDITNIRRWGKERATRERCFLLEMTSCGDWQGTRGGGGGFRKLFCMPLEAFINLVQDDDEETDCPPVARGHSSKVFKTRPVIKPRGPSLAQSAWRE